MILKHLYWSENYYYNNNYKSLHTPSKRSMFYCTIEGNHWILSKVSYTQDQWCQMILIAHSNLLQYNTLWWRPAYAVSRRGTPRTDDDDAPPSVALVPLSTLTLCITVDFRCRLLVTTVKSDSFKFATHFAQEVEALLPRSVSGWGIEMLAIDSFSLSAVGLVFTAVVVFVGTLRTKSPSQRNLIQLRLFCSPALIFVWPLCTNPTHSNEAAELFPNPLRWTLVKSLTVHVHQRHQILQICHQPLSAVCF